jgi:hypothetical protein
MHCQDSQSTHRIEYLAQPKAKSPAWCEAVKSMDPREFIPYWETVTHRGRKYVDAEMRAPALVSFIKRNRCQTRYELK